MGQLAGTYTNVVLITGTRGAGKTSLLRHLHAELQDSGLQIAGVISPAVFSGAEKIAIDLLVIQSGENRRLASKRNNKNTEIMTDRWSFDATTLKWGNQALAQATPCDLLIIDELGPIEFDRGLGLQNGIRAVDKGEYQLALVVIRPELIANALQRWPGVEVIDVTENATQAYHELTQKIDALHV